jgi:peptidoglycan/LPS O-acetylase OafA/YrhL
MSSRQVIPRIAYSRTTFIRVPIEELMVLPRSDWLRLRRDAERLAHVSEPRAATWSARAFSFAAAAFLSALGSLAGGTNPADPILVALVVLALSAGAAAIALHQVGNREREQHRISLFLLIEEMEELEQRSWSRG